jgi:phosphate starvation-inducible PhoH-like protein
LNNSESLSFTLSHSDTAALASLCGQYNEHLKLIEKRLNVVISNRATDFQVTGAPRLTERVVQLLKQMNQDACEGKTIDLEQVHLSLQQSGIEQENTSSEGSADDSLVIRTRKVLVKPRGPNQQKYVRSILSHDINFGIGPAGTGKTYLAVACAVEALEREEIERILLVRPAVEAGEKLGFLPGDLAQKVDPYLRPLYDALFEMLGFERVAKLIERHVIEVAPLAYMRGRTLNGSFVILDESQNTTREQMKMFLTRIGFGSTAVITGDITQVDLPKGVPSGLRHAAEVLNGVPGIGFNYFSSKDVVRHHLIQHIVEAYDRYDLQKTNPPHKLTVTR